MQLKKMLYLLPAMIGVLLFDFAIMSNQYPFALAAFLLIWIYNYNILRRKQMNCTLYLLHLFVEIVLPLVSSKGNALLSQIQIFFPLVLCLPKIC